MSGSKVSIVIPVFNGEKYLSGSIRSALSQTYPNIEVIVVNDGSTDRSMEIAKQIEDDRLIVVDQPNGGVTAARKSGIERSEGDWICFLDSDDTLPLNAIEAYSEFLEEAPDIIVSGVKDQITIEDYLCGLLRLKIRPELWGKLFRSEVVRNYMPFPDRKIVMGEDLFQNLILGLNARTISTIPELQYDINLENQASVTKVFKRTFEYEDSYFKMLDESFLSKCKNFTFYGQVEECAYWLKLNGLKRVVLDGNHIDLRSALWKETRNYFSKNHTTLGPSERLLLKLSGCQLLYRMIMKLYLRGRV